MEEKNYTTAIDNCLKGKEDRNRIFPFLWVHGEPHDRLRDELDAICNCGLRAFCVESRPHPEFCEEGWWNDLGFILSYAKQRNMQVWVLDDKHFPTGYANSAIEKKYPHLRRKSVRIACVDVTGPMDDVCQLLPQIDGDESILYVCAFRRTGNAEDVDGSSGMLLENIRDGLIFWNIPEGVWRVFFVIRTNRGPAHFRNYIDMCDADSCKVMVKEIYEPHYTHFKSYFGNTFQGFFSDEPCFANNIGSFSDTLGIPNLILPWKDDMISRLAQSTGYPEQEAKLLLPSLWFTVTERTAAMRFAYMDIVTKLYRDNFSAMLGNWCEQHGVSYIGHVIEDLGAHMRLGYGCGHYFRAMSGQHMAGMDIVLHQIVPGITNMVHTYSTGSGRRAEPDFYHFTAPKLAASAAHLDPKKQGRTMCEIYGAYGWAEGIPTMKYLTDCMLSAGINHFVPHAFSDKIEDPDCPPHFYNGGNNPQYPVFTDLMAYTHRLSHILSSGKPCVPVAVYYNAESEWSGGVCQQIQDIAAALGRVQTDLDFVPMDDLLEATAFDGKLQACACCYQVLLVPFCQVLPQALAEKLEDLANSGVAVLYVDKCPEMNEFGVALHQDGNVISLDNLPLVLQKCGLCGIQTDCKEPDLRVLHRKDGEFDLYFFFNASNAHTVDTYIHFDEPYSIVAYDGWLNEVQPANNHLCVAPGQSVLWCVTSAASAEQKHTQSWQSLTLDTIKVKLEQQGQVIHQEIITSDNLKNYASTFSRFSGTICYEFFCNVEYTVQKIRLGSVGETARLWVNGEFCGTAVQAPYEFKVEKHWNKRDNKIVIEVSVNQAYGRRDRYSSQLLLPPMGLLGEIQALPLEF